MYSTDPTAATTAMSSGAVAAFVGIMLVYILFWIVILVLVIMGMWKAFKKAGKPGWAAIIPIYNVIVMLEIAERPIWWVFLLLIPFVNLVIVIMVYLDIAKKFGKSVVFAIFGLMLFSPIGWMMLGFGKAQYQGAISDAPEMPTTQPPVAPIEPPVSAPPVEPVAPAEPAAPVDAPPTDQPQA